jgi:hypothetical protein
MANDQPIASSEQRCVGELENFPFTDTASSAIFVELREIPKLLAIHFWFIFPWWSVEEFVEEAGAAWVVVAGKDTCQFGVFGNGFLGESLDARRGSECNHSFSLVIKLTSFWVSSSVNGSAVFGSWREIDRSSSSRQSPKENPRIVGSGGFRRWWKFLAGSTHINTSGPNRGLGGNNKGGLPNFHGDCRKRAKMLC